MKGNPYPGTREFKIEDEENFFGRWEEIEILAGMVQARRVSLLFAQSGAGKSSLINAGLIPELTRQEQIGRGRRRRTVQKMYVLPVTGVGGGIPSTLSRPVENVFTLSALYSMFPDSEPDELAGQRLATGLGPLVEAAGSEAPVLLVLDQLEQLFTHHTDRWQERQPFFEQVAEALEQYPGLHLLLAMREDFIAELTPLAGLLPGELRDRFRLERLRPEQAQWAVQRPAEQAGCPFAEGVADGLIANLRRAQVGQRKTTWPGATPADADQPLGEYIEPVHLQIVCHQLWEKLDSSRTSIVEDDVRELGDVDQALSGFYEEGLHRVLAGTRVREHRLRDWFEKTPLITPNRTRGLVYRGAERTEGLVNEAVDLLVESYLVRSIQRGSDTWHELAHDRLVEPILASNQVWRDRHARPLTVAVEAWEASGRDPRKLLSGAQLADALATAANSGETTQSEMEFLTASRRTEAAATAAAKARLRLLQLTAISVVAVILTIATAISIWLYFKADQAREQVEEKEIELRSALVRSHLEDARRTDHSGRRSQALAYLALSLRADPMSTIARGVTIGQLSSVGIMMPLPHDQRVSSAAFSPDSKLVVTASWDGTAKIWEVTTGRLVGEPMPHGGPVESAAFSPDGERVLTRSGKTVRVWEVKTGRLFGEPIRHDGKVLYAAFSPDGERVVTASSRTVRLWEAATGYSVGVPMRHDSWVNAAAFSPDGGRVVIASGKTVRLWDAGNGRPMGEPMVHDSWVESASFSPGGDQVVTASSDGARLWHGRSGLPIGVLPRQKMPVSVASFSPDGRRVVTASHDRAARLWDIATRLPLGAPMQHDDVIRWASFSPDGKLIVTASLDDTARIWNAYTGAPVGAPMYHDNDVCSAELSPDGERVVTVAEGNTAYLWSRLWLVSTRRPVGEPIQHDQTVWSASFSPDGKLLLTVPEDGSARLWQVSTGQAVGEPMRHEDLIVSASFSPDSKLVVTASEDSTARMWDTSQGWRWPTASLELRHRDALRSASFSPDNKRVVTASTDKTARLWEAKTGHRLGELMQHDGKVFYAAFSPDGRMVVTASEDKTARLWDGTTGHPLGEPLQHDDPVQLAAFSPDSKWLVTVSADRIQLWRTETSQHRGETAGQSFTLVGKPMWHDKRVNSAVFSPDGLRLVTASDDSTVRLWDAATGMPVGEPMLHQDRVSSARFSPDGTRVVTASDDGAVCLWDAAFGRLLGEPMLHRGRVNSASFSPDGQRVVTASADHTARLWDALIVPGAESDLLAELAEVVGGHTVTELGNLQPIPPMKWQARFARLRALGEQAPDNQPTVASFIRWYLSHPFARTISPLSRMTVDEYVRQMLALAADEARQEAESTYPGHPLLTTPP
jgi:WD40 repeat protein